AGAAVAHREVHPAVRAEREHAAVVIPVRVGAREQRPWRRSAVAIRPVFDDARGSIARRVLDVELLDLRIRRVEREPEQPLFLTRGVDEVTDVEERSRATLAAVE